MDHAVAAAYGWTDLNLGHGFHQTKQGIRYTISDAARPTVLDRLLALNHERYAAEQSEAAACPWRSPYNTQVTCRVNRAGVLSSTVLYSLAKSSLPCPEARFQVNRSDITDP